MSIEVETPDELRAATGIDDLRERVRELEQENEQLREFLSDIGYPDTAIDVILDATEVVDALEEGTQDED